MKVSKILSSLLGVVLVLSMSVAADEAEIKIIEDPNGERYECVEISPNSRTAMPKIDVEVDLGDDLAELPAELTIYKVLNGGVRSTEESQLYIAHIDQPVVFSDYYYEEKNDADSGLDGASIAGNMYYEVNSVIGVVRYISANIGYYDGRNGTVLLDKMYYAHTGNNGLRDRVNVPNSYSSYGKTYDYYTNGSSVHLEGKATAYNGSYRDDLSFYIQTWF